MTRKNLIEKLTSKPVIFMGVSKTLYKKDVLKTYLDKDYRGSFHDERTYRKRSKDLVCNENGSVLGFDKNDEYHHYEYGDCVIYIITKTWHDEFDDIEKQKYLYYLLAK